MARKGPKRASTLLYYKGDYGLTQGLHMSNFPTISPSTLPDQFYIDLAVGVYPFEEICDMYGVDPTQGASVESTPEFQQRFLLAKQAVEDDGRAFRARCRTVVHNAIPHMERLMHDPETPASTQLETFKAMAKYGKLEPERVQDTQNSGGPQLVLNIIGPDGATGFSLNAQPSAGRVLEHDPDDAYSDRYQDDPIASAHEVSGFF